MLRSLWHIGTADEAKSSLTLFETLPSQIRSKSNQKLFEMRPKREKSSLNFFELNPTRVQVASLKFLFLVIRKTFHH